MTAPTFIDTHVHLDAEVYDVDRDAVISRARAAGVSHFICIGASRGFESNERALNLAATHREISATVGIHPQDASIPLDIERLSALASRPKVVAIGETGLDYFRDSASREDQVAWFRAHIALAKSKQLPLVIHSRDSGADCLALLKGDGASSVGGVFHCFSESAEFARELRSLHFYVSVPGILTFKKNDQYRATFKEIPLEQILLETDAPYLAPDPFRGKRNESAYMVRTAEVLAQIHETSVEEIGKITSSNAVKLFKIPLVKEDAQ